jgi:hypothetical protein
MQGIRRVVVLLNAIVAWAMPSHAADSIAHCVGIDDDAARLACFDAATGRAGRSTSQRPDASAVPAAQTTSQRAPGQLAATGPGLAEAAPTQARTPAQTTAEFGLSAAALAKDQRLKSITATVQAVGQSSHVGRWTVTLDNGQVWEQRESGSTAQRPRPGDRVTIEQASFGSYLLTAPGRGSNRVRRIR